MRKYFNWLDQRDFNNCNQFPADGQYLRGFWKYDSKNNYFFVESWGGAGWKNVQSRAESEGIISLKVENPDAITLYRVALAINAFHGISNESLTKVVRGWATFTHNLQSSLYSLERIPFEQGGWEAKRLMGYWKTVNNKKNFGILTCKDVSEHVESKGYQFNYGIYHNDQLLIDQTFRQADAERLCVCYNAAGNLTNTTLEADIPSRVVDLIRTMIEMGVNDGWLNEFIHDFFDDIMVVW